MSDEPRSELARYAFGYSDKKPGATFWVPLALATFWVIYKMVGLSWT